MLARFVILALTLAMATVLAWPATWAKGRDSFPLSPYPMFARKRTSPSLTLEYAVVLNASGKRSFVSPSEIGSQEVLQARALIHGAIARGTQQSKLFCSQVLQRVQEQSPRVVELRLVRGTHDAVAYLQGDTSASKEKVLVTCQSK